jgi:hypothetical protein
MRKLFFPIAFASVLLPMIAAGQSVFDGTWKYDLSKFTYPTKPDVIVLEKGMFSCKTCAPAYTVKADGTDQPVTGHPYFDSVAIKVVNDKQIEETDKKDGKVVATTKTIVSPDGNTAQYEFIDSSNTNGGPPVTGKGASTRVAKGPVGSHAVSGSWRESKVENLSENATVWSYKVNGDEITMTTPTGQSYTAKLDGTDAPMKGDPGTTSVSVKMLGKNTLEESDKRDGKVIVRWTMTVAEDGKTASGTIEDKLANKTNQYGATKQ